MVKNAILWTLRAIGAVCAIAVLSTAFLYALDGGWWLLCAIRDESLTRANILVGGIIGFVASILLFAVVYDVGK